jgi:hypothetical protein
VSVAKDDTVSSSDSRATQQQVTESEAALAALRNDLEQLRQKISKFPNWLTVTGTVCGIAVAIVSIISGLYSHFWRAPQLKLVASPTLTLTYSPQGRNLGLEWSFSIGNDGDLPNIVNNVTGEIHDSDDISKQIIVFGPTDLNCLAGQSKIRVPFVVGQGLPISLTCTAIAYLPEQGHLILRDGSSKKFTFSIKGQKQTSSSSEYCFDLPDQEITRLDSGNQKFSDRFVYSSCDLGAK